MRRTRLLLVLTALLQGGGEVPALESFHAPAQPQGSLTVRLYPCEGVGGRQLVTFGLPLPRGSLDVAGLATVRVLSGGVEIPAFVEQLTPWRHLSDAAQDGASVRVARIQIEHDLVAAHPGHDTITVQWGGTARSAHRATLLDPRQGWRLAVEGSFVAADGVHEPRVYACLPATQLSQGLLRPTRMDPFDATIGEARDDPRDFDHSHFHPAYLWDQYGAKNFLFSIVNEDDPLVSGDGLCDYKTSGGTEAWLFDRASTMYGLYLRTGWIKPLREAVRCAVFYERQIGSDGFFAFKPGDAKYAYNECLAYTHWLTGDPVMVDGIARVLKAHSGTRMRWSPSYGFWTERHTGFKLIAHCVAWEVLGGTTRRDQVLEYSGDYIWHQDGAGGQLPADRPDGALWHYGSQHDWDWDPGELGASPWMSAQIAFDGMLRVYHGGEQPAVADWLRRHGDFLVFALTTHPDGWEYPFYAIHLDGRPGENDIWSDHQHALEVAASIAWSRYFALLRTGGDGGFGAKADSLYRTYDIHMPGWVRPDGPAEIGKAAWRVQPWRKYNWEYRTSGGFSWAMRQVAGGANTPPQVAGITVTPDPVTGTTASASAVASDADGDALAYSWTAVGPGSVAIAAPGAASTTLGFSQPGSYTVSVAVDDGRGGSDQTSVVIQVLQTPTSIVVSP